MDGRIIVNLLKPHTTEQNKQFLQDVSENRLTTYSREQWNPSNTANTDKQPKKLTRSNAETYIYLPKRIQEGINRNALFAYHGRGTGKQPEGWDVELLGPHFPGDKIDKVNLQHFPDISEACQHLIAYNNVSYILPAEKAAPFLVCGRFRGSMGNIAASIRDHSFEHLFFDKDLTPVPQELFDSTIGRINPAINDEAFEDGRHMLWAAGEMIEWGHFYRRGLRINVEEAKSCMTENQPLEFRSLFEQFGQGWIGARLHRDEFCEIIKSRLDKDWLNAFNKRKNKMSLEESIWTNVKMLCRNSPDALNCFGFKTVQIGSPLYFCRHCKHFSKEAIGRALGRRLTDLNNDRDMSLIAGKICTKNDEIAAPVIDLLAPVKYQD